MPRAKGGAPRSVKSYSAAQAIAQGRLRCNHADAYENFVWEHLFMMGMPVMLAHNRATTRLVEKFYDEYRALYLDAKKELGI